MRLISNDILLPLADKHGLPPSIIQAIVQVESKGNWFACRAEPAYAYLWDVNQQKAFRRLPANVVSPPLDFPTRWGSRNTEWWGQKMSWGPMQVMGAVARELGFEGFFPELCTVVGLELGIIFLAKLHHKYFNIYGLDGVIAAYNAGSPRREHERYVNQDYVDKVRRVMKELAE